MIIFKIFSDNIRSIEGRKVYILLDTDIIGDDKIHCHEIYEQMVADESGLANESV